MASDFEGVPDAMRKLFDSKMSELLEAAGVIDGKDDVVESWGSGQIRVFEAGERIDKDTHETIPFEAGITLRQGGIALHVSSSDIALLLHKCKTVKPLKDVLSKRLNEERDLLKAVGF